MHEFEEDLQTLKTRVMNEELFDKELYRALCNVQWQKATEPTMIFSCSWVYAGGIVAELKGNAGFMNYIAYYANGGEGEVSERVLSALRELGWEPIFWPWDGDVQ